MGVVLLRDAQEGDDDLLQLAGTDESLPLATI